MKRDIKNLSVTTDSEEVINEINHFTFQLISSGKNADAIINAAVKCPDNLLIQCYAAVFYLYAQEDRYTLKAIPYLKNAERLLMSANQREKLIYQAVIAWQKLDYELAITILIAITELWPQDCLAAKIAEWMFYCTGQAYQAKRFLAMCKRMQKYNQLNSHFLAIYAFALELSGQFEKSFEVATRAIEIEPNTPWAHHALSHAYLMTTQMEQGIAALESFKPSWETILPALKCHNTWHLALFYLAELNEEKSKTLYTTELWGHAPDTVLEQIDSISFLWRMDMAGLPQDKEWGDICKHLGEHPVQHYTPFHNAHFIYALAKSKGSDAANQAVQQIEDYANSLSGNPYRIWHTISKPFFNGCIAFVNGDYKRASEYLNPISEEVFCLGGSDAQDELFTQTYFVSLMKSGQQKLAMKYFRKHLSHYQNTPLGNYWHANLEKY